MKSRVRNIFIFLLFITILTPLLLTKLFGIGISPILTGSMRPHANPGDVFITRTVEVKSLRVGDIVALHEQVTGSFYAHRIAEIARDGVQYRVRTKGDANNAVDRDAYIATAHSEVAHVIARVPWIGRPMVYITSAQGRQMGLSLIIIANVLGLFVFLFRKPIARAYHHRTSESVYRELYKAERENSEQYREIIEQLHKSSRGSRDENQGMEIVI